jgi:Zn-dependent M28 family amino/carboxypeptidase
MLKDQYIILSAHFDHIGIRKGNNADSINNGADDNASGTCTLLGIAKTIKDSGLKPGRTIVFAEFSGEESGIRGSRFFIANSPVSLKSVFADLNFEMTGHSEYLGRNRYYMTGSKISNLDSIIGEYNKKSDWKLVDTIALANNLFYASDNIAFSRISSTEGISQGIPSGTFATTAISDYLHTPLDEGELFDYENMANLVAYFSELIIWLSETKSEVQFTEPSFTRLK